MSLQVFAFLLVRTLDAGQCVTCVDDAPPIPEQIETIKDNIHAKAQKSAKRDLIIEYVQQKEIFSNKDNMVDFFNYLCFDVDIIMQFKSEKLLSSKSFLENGILKNSFETGQSSGFNDDQFTKMKAEQKYFKYPLDTDARSRIKYGAFNVLGSTKGVTTGNFQYGDCFFVFKREMVGQRVTITPQDSLVSYIMNEAFPIGMIDTTEGLWKLMQYVSFNDPSFFEAIISQWKVWNEYVAETPGVDMPYMEVQFHGELQVFRDADYVVGPSKKKKAFAKLGLPFHTYEEYKALMNGKMVGKKRGASELIDKKKWAAFTKQKSQEFNRVTTFLF